MKILKTIKRFFPLRLTLFSLFLVLTSVVLAQGTPEETAKKYGVTFPVVELGSCANFSECRSYCEDPVNQNTCVDFSKKKGFYKEEQAGQDSQFWQRTKTGLGCDSMESCQAFCEQSANFDKCNSFAKKQGMSGGHIDDPSKAQILEKAKSVLGCTSYESCRSLCENPASAQKCSDFARQVGLHGGVQNVGPGGCNSEETCKKFCSDPSNFQICSSFSSTVGGSFSGPGGCSNEESCHAYCQVNPTECGSFGGPGGANYSPQEMCSKTPSCTWRNNTCECGVYDSQESQRKAEEYAKFCRENPDKCRPSQQGSFGSSQEKEQFEKYCRENPDKCRQQTGRHDPASECTKYPGCSWSGTECKCTSQGGSQLYPTSNPASECTRYGCTWTGSSCQCSGSQGSSAPPPPPGGGSQPDPASACSSQPGCSWTGSTCQCSPPPGSSSQPPPPYDSSQPPPGGGSQPDPATACSQQPGCSWTGSTCQCSGVQGVTTRREGLLERIFKFLFGY